MNKNKETQSGFFVAPSTMFFWGWKASISLVTGECRGGSPRDSMGHRLDHPVFNHPNVCNYSLHGMYKKTTTVGS